MRHSERRLLLKVWALSGRSVVAEAEGSVVKL